MPSLAGGSSGSGSTTVNVDTTINVNVNNTWIVNNGGSGGLLGSGLACYAVRSTMWKFGMQGYGAGQ